MTLFYKLGDKVYINITNACPCSCLFCLRKDGDGVGDAQSLWLEREPELEELKAAFDEYNLADMTEIVFCGYGEPMERADTVMQLSRYMKTKSNLPIRINTNGLVKLINPSFDLSQLCEVDSISVSLNADDEAEYFRLTRSRFGIPSYRAMLAFAEEAKKYTKVVFTLVDVLEAERVEWCRQIADKMGIPLNIRTYITDER